MAKIKKGDIILCNENGYTTLYRFEGSAGGMKDLYNITDDWYDTVPNNYFKGKEVKIFPHDFIEFLLKNQKEEFVTFYHPGEANFPELNKCPICGKSDVVYTACKLKYPYEGEFHYQIFCCHCDLKLDKGLAVSPKALSQIWNRYSKVRWENEI